MIKNIEDLKSIQIVCRNQEQVKNCLNYLEQLGFDIDDFSAYYYDGYNIIFWEERDERFIISNKLKENLKIEFYNKKLIKTLQKFIKQKKEKEEVKDIEVASDGRIMAINNYNCKEHCYFLAVDFDNEEFKDDPVGNGSKILNCDCDFEEAGFYKLLKYGLLFKNDEALDKYLFKLKIETELKNIAERLNAGRKINWKDNTQIKYCIFYDFENDYLNYWDYAHSKNIGQIYCLDKNFLEVAKKEIGEENLIQYLNE